MFTKVLGGELLRDLSSFVSALESMFGGFRERAQHTYELLKEPGTAFVVVATPEPDALREASFFVERLSDERMPLAGLVVNRVHGTALGDTSLPAARAEAAADALAAKPDDPATRLAEAALRVHAELAASAEHDVRMTRRFAAAHPEVPMVSVAALPADVHDLDGLRAIGALLTAAVTARTEAARSTNRPLAASPRRLASRGSSRIEPQPGPGAAEAHRHPGDRRRARGRRAVCRSWAASAWSPSTTPTSSRTPAATCRRPRRRRRRRSTPATARP